MNFRWYLFWVKDFFNGGKIKEAYNDLKNDYICYDFNKQRKRLNDLLIFAKHNCKFYGKYKTDILNFPVINKQIIKDNFDDIFVNSGDINKLHKMSTSGSTGVPFVVYQNIEKRHRVISEVIFFGEIANYHFGELQMFLRSWTKSNKKSFLKRKLQNMIPIDIFSLDDSKLSNILNLFNKKKSLVCVLSYASTLDKLCEYALNNKYTYKNNSLKCFLSSSELLNEDTRKNIFDVFNCKCYSRYANQENGILGQDDGVDKTIYLNETNYYFEFLKLDNDEPAEIGELSRIVVTDLFNYSMPMIRYDTGDLAVFDIVNNKYVIKEIFGRKQDLIYDVNGKPVSPHGISVSMWGIAGIKQWKFIQNDCCNYTVILNVYDNFNLEKKISNILKKLLGSKAIISFQYTDEIPVLNSGKRKYIENISRK